MKHNKIRNLARRAIKCGAEHAWDCLCSRFPSRMAWPSMNLASLIKAKKAYRWNEHLVSEANWATWERETMGRVPPWAR